MADLKLQRQQAKAAVKIQARARGNHDRIHAQQKVVNLHVWLFNLFDHMACKHTKKVDVGLLAGYIQSDPSVLQMLNLPRRFMRLPAMLLTKSFDFVRGFELNPSAYPSRLDWPGVARIFEITDAEAERVLLHQAATKIQAVERGKNTRKKRRTPGNSGHALMPYSLAQMSTGEPVVAAAAERGEAGQETAGEGVTFEEFAGARENADMNYAQARALFDELDVNKDGALDAEELSHYKP